MHDTQAWSQQLFPKVWYLYYCPKYQLQTLEKSAQMAIFRRIEKLHDWNLRQIHFGVPASLVHSFIFVAIMVTNISWLRWNKKKHFHIFQTTKAKTSKLWLQIIWDLGIPGSKFDVLEMSTLRLLQLKRKMWINLKVWKITVQNQIWSK